LPSLFQPEKKEVLEFKNVGPIISGRKSAHKEQKKGSCSITSGREAKAAREK